MKVFILAKHEGSYSDYTMTNLGVFATREGADEVKRRHAEVYEAGCAFSLAQMPHRHSLASWSSTVDEDAFEEAEAKEKASLAADAVVVAVFDRLVAACAAAGVNTAPASLDAYWHHEDPRFDVEEHDLVEVANG